MGMNNEGKIYFTTQHHSDLTWQYSYEEYNEIREEQLNIILGFFEKYPEYGFILDQAYVLQNFIKRNPHQKDRIKSLIDEGKGTLELTGGYLIPDLNLCSGESFVRNCIMGREYYKNEFGVTPNTACLEDAFGMPMQIPQILARLGYYYLLPGRMPNNPSGIGSEEPFIWEGKADTKMVVVQNVTGVDKSSYITNVPVLYNESERFIKSLTDLSNTTGNVLAYYKTEIQMLDEAFFKYLKEINDNPNTKRKVTFGRLADYCKTIDEASLKSYCGEYNPIFTGCYTTRIGVKQKIRAAENALFSAELAGVLSNEKIDTSSAWQQLILAQFHDGACGCHHDVCNDDVNKMLDFAVKNALSICEKALKKGSGQKLAVMNSSAYSGQYLVETTAEALPCGTPVQKDGTKYYFSTDLPAHGAKYLNINKACKVSETKKHDTQAYSGSTDYFSFDFSQTFPKIKSKRYGHNVFGQSRFGEVLFRHEAGSLWAETLLEPPFGCEYQDESVTEVEEGELFIKVTTKGNVQPNKKRPISGNSGSYWTGFKSLSFTKEYIFPLHMPYFKLRLTVDYEGFNTKIALRIPVELDAKKAVALYDTPFAAVERKPYFEVPHKYEETVQTLAKPADYIHAKGDYPALHWVDYSDDKIGLAVANSGTPGHQIVGDDIFISLIRSGTRCLDGTMYPQPGSYDNGLHTFEFSFSDHIAGSPEAAAWVGSLENRKPVAVQTDSEIQSLQANFDAFCFDKANIIVSSIYPNKDTVIVRAYESFGKETSCVMQGVGNAACYTSDMQGEGENQVKLDASKIKFAPYEIKTIVIQNTN